METYLATILLVAPGFIAKRTAKWLGDYSPKANSQIEFVMSYFVYSLFCILLISLIMLWNGMVDANRLTLDFKEIVHTNRDVIKLLLLIIGVSAALGAIWQVVVKKLVLMAANWVNVRTWGNQINVCDTLLNEGICNGKNHLLRVIKDGQEIAVGKFFGTSFIDDEKMELVMDTDPVYKEWLDYKEAKDHFKLKTTYLNFTDNIIVEEYNFPEGFFNAGFHFVPLDVEGDLGGEGGLDCERNAEGTELLS